jgi:hypothetical protein
MPQYSPVAAEGSSQDHEEITLAWKYPKRYTVFTSSLVLIGLTITTYIYASISASLSPQMKFPKIESCGVTPTQARSNGCRFDVTSFSWLPPACYDDLLVANFLALEPWEWFSDPLGTRPVPLEAIQ